MPRAGSAAAAAGRARRRLVIAGGWPDACASLKAKELSRALRQVRWREAGHPGEHRSQLPRKHFADSVQNTVWRRPAVARTMRPLGIATARPAWTSTAH